MSGTVRPGSWSDVTGIKPGDVRDGFRIMSDDGTSIPEAWFEAKRREQHRAALVRALTAQAWAVACEMRMALIDIPEDCCDDSIGTAIWSRAVSRVADLPSPFALADDLLGIPPR